MALVGAKLGNGFDTGLTLNNGKLMRCVRPVDLMR